MLGGPILCILEQEHRERHFCANARPCRSRDKYVGRRVVRQLAGSTFFLSELAQTTVSLGLVAVS